MDVCVLIFLLVEVINCIKVEIVEVGFLVLVVGYVGDGNFYFLILIDFEDFEELVKVKLLVFLLNKMVLEFEGIVIGEYGVGIGKMFYLIEEYGVVLNVMVMIKKVFDLDNIMNPGKMVQIN